MCVFRALSGSDWLKARRRFSFTFLTNTISRAPPSIGALYRDNLDFLYCDTSIHLPDVSTRDFYDSFWLLILFIHLVFIDFLLSMIINEARDRN